MKTLHAAVVVLGLFDAARNKVYAFLPQSHRAAVFLDRE